MNNLANYGSSSDSEGESKLLQRNPLEASNDVDQESRKLEPKKEAKLDKSPKKTKEPNSTSPIKRTRDLEKSPSKRTNEKSTIELKSPVQETRQSATRTNDVIEEEIGGPIDDLKPKSPRKQSPPRRMSPDSTPKIIIPPSKLYTILQEKGLLSTEDLPTVTSKPTELLQKKITTWMSLKKLGKHFNEQLMGNHTFRNPMIMSKMVEFMELDPTRTKLDLHKTDILILEKEEPKAKKQRTEKSQLYDHFTKAKGPQPKGRKRRI